MQKRAFKQAIKKRKSYLVSYPADRCLGKTTLILKLSKKYKKNIITRYHCGYYPYISDQGFMVKEHLLKDSDNGRIFFVDGINEEVMYQLLSRGYILIGYAD